MANDDFDVRNLLRSLQQCELDEKLDLASYLSAYDEICRFFMVMGKSFSFVISDIKDKVSILRNYISSYEEYKTVYGMINHEVMNSLLEQNRTPPSACRTLLRLHRALLFTMKFITSIKSVEMDEKLTSYIQADYNNTLAVHHAFYIKTAVRMALHLLPSKAGLLKKLTKYEQHETLVCMEEVSAVGMRIYNQVQNWYSEYNLLDLP